VKDDDQMDGPNAKRGGILLGVLLFIAVAFALPGGLVRAEDPPRRVLILHAYNHTFPATTLISDAVRKRLSERFPQRLEIDSEFLDLAKHPDAVHASRMANFLREKYAGVRFDVVVVIGFTAVPFIREHRDLIAPGVPIVFSDLTRATYEAMHLPPDFTGVITYPDTEKTLQLAERLQPGARRLVVISGTDSLDRRWHETARKAIEAHHPKLETAYWTDLTYDALLADVSRLPGDTIVMLLTVFADINGKRLVPRDVAAAVAKASSAPVYGLFETYIGNGIVGGYTDSYQSIGTTTGDVALEILSGTDVTTLSPRSNPNPAFRVDARAMDRWGLKRSNLPPGSIVLFHEPTLWEQRRYLVSAVALVLALQSAVVAALLFQRSRRRQAENSLRESEDRMTFTAASVNVGLWQFNRATDELWATEHSRALFGLAKDIPLTLNTFLAAVHPEDRRVAVGTLRGILKSQSATADVRVVRPDGKVRWVRVRARSHLDARGTPDQLNGIFIDITDQKAAESEAELQRQEVAHLMRVSVLGELSGAIAHEVNQPLTAILSNAQAALYLLGRDSPNLAEVHDALLDIVQENNRAGEVIQRLRGLLKKGESRSEPVDLNELVDSTTALLRSELIERRITVETDLAVDLPTVFGDSVQLQQVLLNLIVNAMDAMASTPVEQRRVTICTRETPASAIELLVRDHGPGITTADGKQVFVPFYTTKDHGLGLGLTICSTIIRKHGGTINLRNDDAGGAVAEISLPARVVLMAAQ
jgi:PAS domain S-box-containing protein